MACILYTCNGGKSISLQGIPEGRFLHFQLQMQSCLLTLSFNRKIHVADDDKRRSTDLIPGVYEGKKREALCLHLFKIKREKNALSCIERIWQRCIIIQILPLSCGVIT